MLDIGAQIHKLRKSRGWSLKELAHRAGLSMSFLSRVERNLSSLSIASLELIATALGISLKGILETDLDCGESGTQKCSVFRRDEQWIFTIPNSSVSYRDLGIRMKEWPFEILLNQFQQHYAHPMVQHEGEEFGYVLDGEITLKVEDQSYVISEGDCYFIQPRTMHTYQTNGEHIIRVLMISTKHFLK